MTRVSTYGNYQSALLDLMSAQTRAQDAQTRVSTQKNATSLTGFGRTSESLTAFKSGQARIQGFIDTGEAVAARLTSQDLAFDRIGQGVSGARQAIADALAAGRLDGLMQEMQAQFQISQDGLNSKHQGRYLFAGGNTETAPVPILALADLAAAPDAASLFANDTLRQASRLDEGTTMETGFLADEAGQAAFEVFRDIQIYHQTTPIDGSISEATRDFLSTQLARLDAAYTGVTDLAARNGSMQNRVDAIVKSQNDQKAALEELIAGKTDADMAQALTDLQLSQIAIQASAQVVSQLRDVSLLNYLR
ncbi:hypothetical protein GVN24_31680 [Rhizobium sp. CRIBSB]|nr:hypothetical protein [Rhizobium sp. CRIBSB]